MISYGEFYKYMEAIEEYLLEFDNVNDALSKMCPDSYAMITIGTKLLDSYIELVEELVGDETGLISYFVFDCDFGKEPKQVIVNDVTFIFDSVYTVYEALS